MVDVGACLRTAVDQALSLRSVEDGHAISPDDDDTSAAEGA